MANRPRLLLVEDDPALVELLEFRFDAEGYHVITTDDGDEALLLVEEQQPDVIILDWMINGTSGIEVCRRLRRARGTAHIPVIMLTARESEQDRVRGLEVGADDYVVKPFSPRELLARVEAVLRRSRPALKSQALSVGDFTLYPDEHKFMRGDKRLDLGPTEHRLLAFFIENPGRVLSRSQLLDRVWGVGSDIEMRTVDVHIARLRKAVSRAGKTNPIKTVRAVGYIFEPEI